MKKVIQHYPQVYLNINNNLSGFLAFPRYYYYYCIYIYKKKLF